MKINLKEVSSDWKTVVSKFRTVLINVYQGDSLLNNHVEISCYIQFGTYLTWERDKNVTRNQKCVND